MTCSQGALGYLFTKDGTGDQSHAATDIDDLLSEDYSTIEGYIGGDFIRGTRSRDINQVRKETIGVGGSIQIPWSYAASQKWSKRILGGGATGSWTVAETLQAFFMCIRKGGTPTNYEYINNKVASATISGSRGSPIVLDVNVIGTTETTNVDAALTLATYSDTYQPYILNDVVLTINSVAYPFRSFSLSVDNMVDVDFTNSLTATDICPQDRVVTLSIDGKQGDLAALYALDFSAGLGASIAITNSAGYTFTAAGTEFVYEKRTANIPGRGTIMLPVQGTFYASRSAGTKEITFTDTSPS